MLCPKQTFKGASQANRSSLFLKLNDIYLSIIAFGVPSGRKFNYDQGVYVLTLAKRVGSCKITHSTIYTASESILMLDVVRRFSPATRCYECRQRMRNKEERSREVENMRTAWFGRFMKLLQMKVRHHEIEVYRMSSQIRRIIN